MKHIVVGDLHGKDCWREINVAKYDKVVFLGDYTDDWKVTDEQIYANLEHIISLKMVNWGKVELLLGNHDIQYLYYPQFKCSGFRGSMQPQLTYLFNRYKNCFNVAYQKDDHIFTHAGITNSWYQDFLKLPIIAGYRDQNDKIADLLNMADQTAQRILLHNAGHFRGGYGDGGITWADKDETMIDMLENYHQVVGHTSVPEVETVHKDAGSITYVDVLDTMTFFYEVEIGD